MFDERWTEMQNFGFPSVQDEAELRWLYDHIRGANSYLEIGTSFGGSLHVIADALAPNSTIVSVDLPKFRSNPMKWDRDREHFEQVDTVADYWRDQGHTVHIIRADSHDPYIIELVRSYGPYDAVFIDGDHSLNGVTLDHVNYGPMARVEYFHDINTPNVKDFWADLKGRKDAIVTEYGMGRYEQV